MGGLGNQMFQYAAGRALALRRGTELKLDLGFLLDRTPVQNFIFRDYDLEIFNTKAAIATKQEINNILGQGSDNSLLSKVNLLKYKLNPPSIIIEPHPHYSNVLIHAPKNVYMKGYWQSEQYFEDFEMQIRNDLTFKTPLSGHAAILEAQIRNVNAVCINVRRGDFVDNPSSRDHHGFVGLDYFNNAVKIIEEKFSDPHFFIFSDDVEWCRENIVLAHPFRVVDHTYAGEKFQGYMQLMIACRHFIIPNSTFGWWAAWLSTDPQKTVIAPKQWFVHNDRNTSDLIPSKWKRV